MKLKIVSDGTNAGTHLIDEDTGEVIHKISKLTWEASSDDPLTKATVEFTNIPVEIVSKAKVDLYEFQGPDFTSVHTKTFEKEIKIASDKGKPGYSTHVKIFDTETNEQVGAVQTVKWEATPHDRKATLTKIKFDKKDWVKKDV
jgi:hypothetical protein